jgi:hypothetical protein
MEGMENQPLKREGIFKVKPLSWSVRTKEGSQSVGVSIEFLVQAQLDGAEWVSWSEAAPHVVRGTYYIVGKEGAVNQTAVDQLVKSLKWNGSLDTFMDLPPDIEVQVTVKSEIYNGEEIYKAGWMNPGDFVPSFGASPEKVKDLNNRYGSLLRAAVGAAK